MLMDLVDGTWHTCPEILPAVDVGTLACEAPVLVPQLVQVTAGSQVNYGITDCLPGYFHCLFQWPS